MFKKLLHGKRKSALLNLTWSGLLCRVVWSVSQLLYLLQRAGHFKFFSPSFFVGLELVTPLFDLALNTHQEHCSLQVAAGLCRDKINIKFTVNVQLSLASSTSNNAPASL